MTCSRPSRQPYSALTSIICDTSDSERSAVTPAPTCSEAVLYRIQKRHMQVRSRAFTQLRHIRCKTIALCVTAGLCKTPCVHFAWVLAEL